MKKFVFAIRDVVTDSYFDPMCVIHLGEAERAFGDLVNDPKSVLFKHPEDYELYQLGSFDNGTGMYEVGVPRQISSGKVVFRGPAVSPLQADAFDKR